MCEENICPDVSCCIIEAAVLKIVGYGFGRWVEMNRSDRMLHVMLRNLGYSVIDPGSLW